MSSYDLSGVGVQALSTSVTRITVAVLAFGTRYSVGEASPANYFKLGLLRFGIGGAYAPATPIDGASIYRDAPAGADALGYSLWPGVSVRVTEVF